MAAQSVFAWGAFTDEFVCKSKSVEAHICHAAAQADGGYTDLRTIKIEGKTYEKKDVTVLSDQDGGYGMASVLMVRPNGYEGKAVTLVLVDETSENKKVLIRKRDKLDQVKLVTEKLKCELVDDVEITDTSFCGRD